MKSEFFSEAVAAACKRGPYIVAALATTMLSGCNLFSASADLATNGQPPVTYAPPHQEFAGHLKQDKLELLFLETPDLNNVAWSNALIPPLEIEKNFVFSDTFLDEDRRPWRAEMHKRFSPVVKDCKTRREAILAVAKNAATVCGVEYSTKRRAPNQCVAESLESGKASCTGLSILLAAAYRSVGIPARIAGVGEWGDRPGNHTWVEVWDDDGWHVVEYYPDKDGLDKGWIFEPIAKLDPANPRSRVFAVDPAGTTFFFLPWDPENKSVRATDRTEDYLRLAGGRKTATASDTGTVVFESRDKSGARVALAFRILDGDREVFSGTTPGPLDDLNHAPRTELKLNREYTAVYTDGSGATRTGKVSAKAGGTVTVIFPR